MISIESDGTLVVELKLKDKSKRAKTKIMIHPFANGQGVRMSLYADNNENMYDSIDIVSTNKKDVVFVDSWKSDSQDSDRIDTMVSREIKKKLEIKKREIAETKEQELRKKWNQN